jgi:RNA polymerase sigma-70 factor (ECF subfamily)
MSKDVSDATLLARFHSGDGDALDQLFARYEAPLFQFLVGMLKDHHRSEDALQETFVRALSRLDGVDPDHLRGWLFTVAYHQAMLAKRREKNRPADALGEPGFVPDRERGPLERAEQADEVRRLRRLIEQLPAAQQEVIRRRVYEGQRFRDIADELRCPLNTALARMHEGVKRLRLMWEADHA